MRFKTLILFISLLSGVAFSGSLNLPIQCVILTGDVGGGDFILSQNGDEYYTSFLVADGTDLSVANFSLTDSNDRRLTFDGIYKYRGENYQIVLKLEESPMEGLWGAYLTRYLTKEEKSLPENDGIELFKGTAMCGAI